MKKHRGLMMALVLFVSILGGVILTVCIFGYKTVMAWLLMSMATIQCGMATVLATYLIENERLQRVIAGFIKVAVPVVIGLGTAGLARSEDVFIFVLRILLGSMYIALFVCVASVVRCVYKVITKQDQTE